MTYLPPGAREALSSMGEAELTELLAEVRPAQESDDPMERAAQALRRSLGVDRPGKATKEHAANAMRQYGASTRKQRGAAGADRPGKATKEQAVNALRQYGANTQKRKGTVGK